MPKERERLIRTRGQAIAVVLLSRLLACSRFWHSILHHPAKFEWIFLFNSWLPNWLALFANMFT